MSDSSITILHVDDDKEIVGLVREYIEIHHDGIDISTEWNGEDALAHLERTDDVDCVISDYRMPGLNGLELLEAVRERWPNLPFILFTENGSEWVAERAISLNVTGYVQKRPGRNWLATLVDRIRSGVEQHQNESTTDRTTHRTDAEFQLLVETADDNAVFSLDEDGYVQSWNAGGERIKGYTSEEIIGQHVSVFYPQEAIEANIPERHLREAADEGTVRDEGWRVDREGRKFPAKVVISATHEQGGNGATRYTSSTGDQTREIENQSLRDQNEQLNHLLAAIAHDLRGPLAVVGGNMALARDTDNLARLDRAEQALGRTNDLLDYLEALAEEGRPIMEPEPVDLRDVAERAWRNIVTDKEDLTVEESTTLLADRHRLQQLFENLFRNAIEHVGPDVAVSVGLFENGGFYVKDDGPGIPEPERSEVFELGYSGDDDGSGLGLAICQYIVEAHGWEIEITGESDGGTRFEVSGVDLDEGPSEPHLSHRV